MCVPGHSLFPEVHRFQFLYPHLQVSTVYSVSGALGNNLIWLLEGFLQLDLEINPASVLSPQSFWFYGSLHKILGSVRDIWVNLSNCFIINKATLCMKSKAVPLHVFRVHQVILIFKILLKNIIETKILALQCLVLNVYKRKFT